MPKADIRSIMVISAEQAGYCGWPTITRRRSGELLVVFSGNRESHVSPFGTLQIIRSLDDGYTWSPARTLADTPLDDRDAGVLETRQGTLLVNWFTSCYWLDHDWQRALRNPRNPVNRDCDFPPPRFERWKKAADATTPAVRQKHLGRWMIRSTDGGKTWSDKYDTVVNSPHGPIELSDGRLLYAGKRMWLDERVGAAQSLDDGRTWQWIGEVPEAPGLKFKDLMELHAVEADNGSIIVHIRNRNEGPLHFETLQTESHDGGRTWTPPHSIGVWGIPSFLMKLHDGRLLMTHGHRRTPLGNQARVSEDHGKTWSDRIIISDDANTWDLGYPSTTQLPDGTLLTVWYERREPEINARLRMARWRLVD